MQHDRLNPQTVAPELYQAVYGVERYVKANVEPRLLHLIKLRASIINGCAFCVDMHANEALADGESTVRLFGLAAWHESPFYSDAERAALALTDAVTHIDREGVPDDVWDEAAKHFDDKQLADLLGAAATINLWNRLAISLRSTPLSARAA
jgi:AhpD family alkylhydroperoxidase